MELNDLLNFIEANAFTVLMVALAVELYRNNRSSFSIAVLVLCVVNLVHLVFDVSMSALFSSSYYSGWIAQLSARLWFIFYAVSDFAAGFLLYKFISRSNLRPCSSCHVISTAYIFLGFVQLARFIDRYVLGADYTSAFYQIAIPATNIFIVVFVVCVVFGRYKREG